MRPEFVLLITVWAVALTFLAALVVMWWKGRKP